MKKFIMVFFIMFIIGCNNKEIEIADIIITGDNELYILETIQLEIDGMINSEYYWESDDINIATVNNGEVYGVSKGIVTISIISNDILLAAHKIEVKEVTLTITGENIIEIGKKTELKVYSVIDNDNFLWTSSDNDIATVENGIITGLGEGMVIIEVYSSKGGYANIEIQVIISFIPNSMEIINLLDEYIVGEPYQIQAVAYPSYSSQEFMWEAIGGNASINKDTGEITFSGEGRVSIICRSKLKPYLVFKTATLNVVYDKDAEVTYMLFIGNSLTNVNDVPKMVESIARATGKLIHCEKLTVGGFTLENIINGHNQTIENTLKNKQFNYIVIQESSWSNFRNYPSFLNSANYFKELADTYNVELILYQTWAAKDNSDYLNNYNLTRQEMQDLVVNSYNSVANAVNCEINRVGEVFYAFSLEHSEINLYTDDIHATLAGSYLASCVHYVSLFNESVIGNNYNVNLAPDIQLLIQTFVSNYLLTD